MLTTETYNFIPDLLYRSIWACILVCMNKAMLQFITQAADPRRHLPIPTGNESSEDYGCRMDTKHECRWSSAPLDPTDVLEGLAGYLPFSQTELLFCLSSFTGDYTSLWMIRLMHLLTHAFNLAKMPKIILQQVLLWSPNPQVCKELGISQIESCFPITKPGAGAHGVAIIRGKNRLLFLPPVNLYLPQTKKEGHQLPAYTKLRPAFYFFMTGVFLYIVALSVWLIKYFCNENRTFVKMLFIPKHSRPCNSEHQTEGNVSC